MAVDVIMPQMGESIFEGTITKWLKKAGDKIERDEPLFEISTDKVDAEIPSPSAGVLKEIKVGEGQTVPIQTVVAVIEAGADGAATAAAPAAAPAKPEAAKPAPPPAAKSAAPAPAALASPAPQAASSGEKVRSSPLVRKIARENNIDVSQVPGTGAGGRVSKSDILSAVQGGGAPAAAASTSAAPASAPQPARPAGVPPATGGASASAVLENAVPREKMYFGHYEVQPMSVMRQRIAEHMVLSKHVSPHVYSVDEADMTAIATLRAKMKSKFEETTGTKLTFMPFFVRAAVEALRAFPTVNSSVDGTNIVLHKECNIGIAVALDWGLIVPV
ncbi:MAG: dihydrolipoamide acetyltransferase family protein, partial [Candidatus Acidiferrales bacterium]